MSTSPILLAWPSRVVLSFSRLDNAASAAGPCHPLPPSLGAWSSVRTCWTSLARSSSFVFAARQSSCVRKMVEVLEEKTLKSWRS
ncbi:hypothetical protein N798_12340 [Knoellia flava TL1]|uniref:Secreted protein n=1 Tax=Knoellia flava TL1 TaxID=1385518 RepID=A0ABR4XEB2_9MICO|nr:hypothetical protein N798_12340 [Knoellia flava TL1]